MSSSGIELSGYMVVASHTPWLMWVAPLSTRFRLTWCLELYSRYGSFRKGRDPNVDPA